MIYILGVDPGRTTGLALIRVDEKTPHLHDLRSSRSETLEDAEDLFRSADYVVCEDWKTRPREATQGSFNYDPMTTTRVLGAAQTLARLLQKPFELQPASIKPVGYGYSNQRYQKGKKGMHVQDAAAHAVYFGVKRKLCNPVRP